MEKVSILIVEDEAIVAMDLEQKLKVMGFEIIGRAMSGKQAMEVFKEKKPDLVLMDINLRGELDGIETVTQMAEIHSTPIIYLTAQADEATFLRAKKTLPAAYLTKPFNERNLQLSIELAIHNFAFQRNIDMPTASIDMVKNTEKREKVLFADSILRTEAAIFIKQNYKFVKIQLSELLYLQADGIYTDIYTLKHKYSLRMTLTQAIEKLELIQVVRIHRSFAVNMRNIEEFNETEVTVAAKILPIGASYREEFLRTFNFS